MKTKIFAIIEYGYEGIEDIYGFYSSLEIAESKRKEFIKTKKLHYGACIEEFILDEDINNG